MHQSHGPILGSLLLTVLPSIAWAQPAGGEFQVNSYTTDKQRFASVSLAPNGNFVVAWTSDGQDGDSLGIFAQRFNSRGNPVGDEFQVNSYTTGSQGEGPAGRQARVSSAGNGSFVVVWSSYGQDGDNFGLFAQRFDRSGIAAGTEFQVNSYTTGEQIGPAVSANRAGDFVVVWTSYGQDGDQSGIFGQRYDRKGNALGAEFQVNSYTTGNQHAPEVASVANGSFVAVWDDDERDGIFGQRFDSGGNRVGGEFQVNTGTTAYEYRPSVASDASGDFVVVWDRGYAYQSDVFGQRFDKRGNAVGGEFQVNSETAENQYYPKVASASNGDFVVVWWSTLYGEIVGQRYNRLGNAVGGEFKANSSATAAYPAIGSAANGDFVVVWQSYGPDGSADGIFGQRFLRERR